MRRMVRASAPSKSVVRRGRSMKWRCASACSVPRFISCRASIAPNNSAPARRSTQVQLPLVPEHERHRLEARCERVFAGKRAIRRRDLAPPRHTELPPQYVRMSFRRPGRDAELLPDLYVRAPGCDQLHDLTLTLGD